MVEKSSVSKPHGYWNSKSNQLQYLHWLQSELEISNYEDWYSIRTKQIKDLGGHQFLRKNDNSISKALNFLLPEYDWKPWLFHQTLKGFWDDMENRRTYLDWLGEVLGYKCLDDWYGISASDFRNNFGASLLFKIHDGSPARVVIENYPEKNWIVWNFSKVPQRYWEDIEKRREAIFWMKEKIGLKSLEDWYSVPQSAFRKHRLFSMLTHQYNSGVYNMLVDIYPENDWKFWKFKKVPNGMWNNPQRQQEYLQWFEQVMNIQSPSDWYHVNADDFAKNHGKSLLFSQFNGSPKQVAESMYPDYEWLHWEFTTVGNGYWDTRENQLYYMNWLGDKLGIICTDDWYKVTRDDFDSNSGSRLYQIHEGYQNAIVELLHNEDGWKRWLFNKVPNKFWDKKGNKLDYMEWLSNQKGIDKLEDWYNYDRELLIRNFGSGLLDKYSSSLQNVLLDLYPDFDWDLSKLYKVGKNQSQLFLIVLDIFPNHEILQNFRSHEKLVFSQTGMNMELDIWLPELNLAFEYQGEQHFHEFHRGHHRSSEDDLEKLKLRDIEKREACARSGITLVEIDYNWERTKQFVIQKIIDSGFDLN